MRPRIAFFGIIAGETGIVLAGTATLTGRHSS
jgi:hypothetical protein